jgi:hypothetical protein
VIVTTTYYQSIALHFIMPVMKLSEYLMHLMGVHLTGMHLMGINKEAGSSGQWGWWIGGREGATGVRTIKEDKSWKGSGEVEERQ